MKTSSPLTLNLLMLLLLPVLTHADDASSSPYSLPTNQTDQYIQTWAAFTGYDLSNTPPSPAVSSLLDVTNTAEAGQYSLLTLFSAQPVNAINSTLAAFAPNDTSYGTLLNPYANATFAKYSTPSSTTSISISPLIDQVATPQPDPINQYITNLLTIPNFTYCLNNNGTAWLTNCPYKLFNTLLPYNVIGDILPGPDEYFSYSFNQAVIPQLNSATLIGPLQYSTTSTTTESSSSSQSSTNAGLTANTQLQEATNFIRYIAGAVAAGQTATLSDYNKAYNVIATATSTTPVSNIINSQNSIMQYIVSYRSYAAQMSVAFNNLYGMLSSRMPQTQPNGTSNSAALSLFQLATGRLYNPSLQSNNQWINQINNASSATVNKEIAATLADILYMLYILHQDNERQLLTTTTAMLASVTSPIFHPPTLDSTSPS